VRYSKYPSYRDSGVEWLGEIPKHWELATVSRLFDIKAGGDVKKEYFSEEHSIDYPYPIYTNSTKKAAVYGYSKKAFFHENTITVSGRGYIGYAIYREHKYDAIIRLLVLSPRNKKPCKFFMYHINDVLDFQVANTAISQLSTEQISPYKVVLPPLQEQQTIANYLDTATAKIDTLIEKQTKLIELLKEKRQAVISTAVTRGLDNTVAMKDSGVGWLGEIPEHWVLSKFAYLSIVVRGGSPRPAGDPTLFNGDYSPWVTVAEITKDIKAYITETETFLTKKGSEQCRVFSKGTLVLSNSGATLGVPKILNINANANDGVVGFENLSPKVLTMYAYYYLFSLTENLRDRMNQGSGQPNLNTDIVKALQIPLPSIEEQNKLVELIDNKTSKIDTLISKSTKAIDLLKEKRTALISSTVTGKIDVRESA